jgi:hypothetical protein
MRSVSSKHPTYLSPQPFTALCPRPILLTTPLLGRHKILDRSRNWKRLPLNSHLPNRVREQRALLMKCGPIRGNCIRTHTPTIHNNTSQGLLNPHLAIEDVPSSIRIYRNSPNNLLQACQVDDFGDGCECEHCGGGAGREVARWLFELPLYTMCSRDVANVVEKHAVHSTAFRAAGETPMVGVRVSACLRSAEEADNIQSGLVFDHSDD